MHMKNKEEWLKKQIIIAVVEGDNFLALTTL